VLGNATTGSAAPTYTTSPVLAGTVTAKAFVPYNLTAGPQSYFFDDFYTATNMQASAIGSPTGNSCGLNGANLSAAHPGQMRLVTGTAGSGTGEACSIDSGAGSETALNAAPVWTKETEVYVPVLPGTTAATYQWGAASTPAASPWTTGVGFELSSTNGVPNDWYCMYGASPTLVDSSQAATAAWVRLTLTNDGTYIHWYINGTEVCGTGVAMGGIVSGEVHPASWTAVAGSATSVTMYADYITLYRAVSR
jgi:hypothetical protein